MVRVALAGALAALAVLAGGAGAAPPPEWTAWVCHPNARPDWCNVDLTTTDLLANGKRAVRHVKQARRRPIDCFYVYPTVSFQERPNADLRVETEVRNAVIVQASYFSQLCRVFAPVYRQRTALAGNGSIPEGSSEIAYASVQAAWRDYLARSNHGRGVVLIGHSQGAFMLSELIRREIEPSPAARRLLVSALLLGGNVVVEKGSDRGGNFTRVPACRSRTQTGCVVAFSVWGRTPPADASLQRVGGPSQQILCVHPGTPSGGRARITPVFPIFNPEGIITRTLRPAVRTFWISMPGLYTAQCVRQGSRAWLQVFPIRTRGDTRELAKEVLSPQMGFHAADVNFPLGELIALVRAQSAAYAKR